MSQIKQYGKVSITFEGEFDQNRSYERLCVVEYAGMSFLSKVDGTTSIPTQNKDEWLQLSVPGPQGPAGERGEQGLRGEKGDYGAKGISTRTVFVYKHSETLPDRPQGGSVDFVGGAIIYPEGWGKSDNIPAPIWRSERTFFEDNSLQDEWSIPMKMSGDDGKPGVDGVNMEFIYKVTKRPTIVPDISNMPSVNVDDYVPVEFGWSDSPNGVTPTNRIEWVCTRKKVNGVWTAWEGPTIWSAYGEKGQDGDGVEYIFYLENTGYPPKNPTPDDWEYDDDYQNVEKEYIPTDLGWTDVARGISEENKFEWQCVRKFRNGFWQPFEGPYLWSRYGDKGNIGDRILEMFAETEDHNPPYVVKDNINPGSIWSITPPVTFDPSKGGAIWSIYTYVDYKNEFVEYEVVENGETIKVSGWSDPIIKTGYNGEDGINPNYRTHIYKKSDEKPELPTFTDPTKFEEAGWKDAPYDDVDGDGSVDIKGRWWECSGLVNGESGEVEWQYIREINGSNSKALFQVTTSRTQPECNKTNNNPGELWKETYNIPNIYQYVWMITGEFDAQGNLVGEWQGPTCITGETPKIEDNGDVTLGGEPTGVNLLNFHIELDNDSEIIPTDFEGNPIGTVSAKTTAQLYNGGILITEGVTYEAVATNCSLNETTNSTGIFEVIGLIEGTEISGYFVEITATYKNIGISKKFNITKSLGKISYKIIASPNVITLHDRGDSGQAQFYIIDSITNKKIINIDDPDIIVGFKYGDNIEDHTNEYNNYMYNVGHYPLIINDNRDIVIKKGSVIIESERVGVIYDGSDGTSIKIKGSLSSTSELPTPPASESDCYVIGLDIYCWDGTTWFNAGQFKGVDGKAPTISDDGYWMFWNGTDYEKTTYYAIGDGHLPYIGANGNWYEWDSVTKNYIDTGILARGKDGQNGTSYYMHIAYSNNSDGTGFVYGSNVVSDYNYIGVYTGTQSDQSKLVKTDYKWTYYRGAEGKQGVAGIPGVSIYLRYQKGNENGPINSTLPSNIDGSSNYWTETIPSVDETYPYIWCTQGRKVYTSETAFTFSWSTPFRLSGTNGLDGVGDKGDPGKIIYPAGLYANNVEYVATDKKAPYVWDSNYGAYYAYLSTTPWIGTDQSNQTPGQEYAANKNTGNNKWELFEQFEAVYAKVGIIANGLIGSAVFSGDYMFSQYGYTTLTGNIPATGDSYQNFNPNNPFAEGNSFYPNVCFNFKTGDFWLQRTKFYVQNGTIKLGAFDITNTGLEYKFTKNDINYIFTIDRSGVWLEREDTGIALFDLRSSGDVEFCSEFIAFDNDGSGSIGNILEWDKNGNRLQDNSKGFLNYGQSQNDEDIRTPNIQLMQTLFINWSPEGKGYLYQPILNVITSSIKNGYLYSVKIFNGWSQSCNYRIYFKDGMAYEDITIEGKSVKTINYFGVNQKYADYIIIE